MVLLDGLEKLINEHGSSTILKERIELANDKYSALESKNEVLRSENEVLRSENEALRFDKEQLKQKNRELEEHITHISNPQEYFEESGALFKRRANGEWDYTPYCPSCKTAMISPARHEPYICGKKSCEQRSSFTYIYIKRYCFTLAKPLTRRSTGAPQIQPFYLSLLVRPVSSVLG